MNSRRLIRNNLVYYWRKHLLAGPGCGHQWSGDYRDAPGG